jgi:hypothetical protein
MTLGTPEALGSGVLFTTEENTTQQERPANAGLW